jgi:ankyrin repeat protein
MCLKRFFLQRSISSSSIEKSIKVSKVYTRERKQANDIYEYLEEPAQKFLNQAASEKRGNLRRQSRTRCTSELISVITLKDILRDYCGLFKPFCIFTKKINAEESLNFLIAITNWRKSYSIHAGDTVLNSAKEIFDRFVGVDAPEPINIDHELAQDLSTKLSAQTLDRSMWSRVQIHILRILETDTVSKFLADPLFLTWKDKEIKRRQSAFDTGNLPPWIAFTRAIRQGYGVESLKYLISQGATSSDEEEETLFSALHLAAKRTDPQAADVISFLISSNANVNALDCQGWTPFHAAAEAANLLACRLLIATGRVNLTAPTSRNRNFAHNLLVLNEYTEDQLPVLKEMLQNIISSNPKENILNCKNLKGEASLHYLTRNSSKCAVLIGEMLLELGASPNVKNRRGYTPLHTAILQEQLDLIRLFIHAGADVSLKCKGRDGIEYTCRELAAMNPRLADITSLLLDKENEINNNNNVGDGLKASGSRQNLAM